MKEDYNFENKPARIYYMLVFTELILGDVNHHDIVQLFEPENEAESISE